jgi:alpha-beta hydrolase superfamily lysophospholipase
MNIGGLHSIAFAMLLLSLATAGCNHPKKAQAQARAFSTPTPSSVSAPITAHVPDAFYDPPADRPHQPGVLLRSELLKNVTLPAGICGWRILYATTVNDTTPATAVATVFAPIDPATEPRPVIAWEHGTTGLMQKCMPSLVSAPTRMIPSIDRIAKAGWVVVASDYSFAEKGGPHPYLIGEGEARAALDSVRAARQMRELTLDRRVVLWGYSQGGHAALWSGIVGPRYAPELEIAGVAAIAPTTNIKNILEINVAMDKRFGAYIALAYSRFYPDITFEQALRPEALAAARQIVNLCDFLPPEESERIEQLATTFDGPALAINSNKALQARLEQNTPNGPIKAPVVIAQGRSDTVVPPRVTDSYVEERCAAGQPLEYWTFATLDHFTIIQAGSPIEELLMKWTKARFANEPPASGCVRKSF